MSEERDARSQAELLPEGGERRALETSALPPVVARLVVEIRSDGSRTIARGAIEDLSIGKSVSIEARGTSPMQLAVSLVGSLLRIPAIGRMAVRALLPSSPPPRRRR